VQNPSNRQDFAMTTAVTVSANHGWPVDVTVIHTDGTAAMNSPIRLPAGETRTFYVWDGADLLIHEVQPGQDAEVGEAVATHQGLPVAGYRDQTSAAIDAVNANKAVEERTLRRLDDLASNQQLQLDGRWFAIGRRAIEQGWMAINRAVFKPTRVRLPEDGE